ncbi:conserved hypothetical protein [Hyphomonas neptunium ATCC 15444]|uniref:Metal-binding protein n=2 Tax=Hyphomonas TaxID=85 RepID=Q0C076_HYPNA|nr:MULTISPECIES: DUF1636 domain-containing protein [Hyphomonas]ABI75664.1 conserved hypothetical protein [Hyphomonas neptunium ATCC 15444]KCZ90552.1 hypothetical protein HHI_13475 [Hyphomonas hirschiana VP5]
MLKPASDAAIVVCSTCRLTETGRENEEGKSGGALLAEAIRAEAARRPESIAIEDMPCLFACQRWCAVHLRAEGKISYVLGDFKPTAEAAAAILDYFQHYLASEQGVVPYKNWPEGVKGHFITRSPPSGKVVG